MADDRSARLRRSRVCTLPRLRWRGYGRRRHRSTSEAVSTRVPKRSPSDFAEAGRLVHAAGDRAEREDPYSLWAGDDASAGAWADSNDRFGVERDPLPIDLDLCATA